MMNVRSCWLANSGVALCKSLNGNFSWICVEFTCST